MPPTSSHLPDSIHPAEEEYSGNFEAGPVNPGPSQHYAPASYHSQPTYLPPHSTLYSQSTPHRSLGPASYPYHQYTHTMSASPATQLSGPTPPYVGSYGLQSQSSASSQRSDSYYPPQSTSTPVMAESIYGHQYMPFRQAHHGVSYPDTSPISSSLPSASMQSPRLESPDRAASEQRARSIDEVNYGSIATNYRHIITTVSQASPSPSTDSSTQSFDPPVVDDMLHRAVEGLRHLDPSRAEQYAYSGDFGPQAVPSGVVAPESPAETVFVRYYEDGKTEGNPTKKKKRERKGATQCASCQATSTPEWRRGPLGPRTLCNACGLVYAKLMKKRAKEEDKLSPGEPSRRARSKGKTRGVTEESEEDRGVEQGSDDTLPPAAGPSGASRAGYPP